MASRSSSVICRWCARTGVALFAALFQASQVGASDLPRVMGTNLCADLLLLSLAAPEQIVSLSRASHDPSRSQVADRVRAYPMNRGGVEDLLYRQPDIALVFQGWTGGRFKGLLAGQDIRLLPMPYPTGWDDALATARTVAREIGRAEEGEAIIAAAEARMHALAEGLPALRTLYLRPGGGSAGAGTFVDDVLTRLGLRNLAREAGHTGWGRFPLERIVADPPELFVLGYFDQALPLTDSSYARHPLLRDLLSRTPSIAVPSNGWGCGGLELLEAATTIAEAVRGLTSTRANRP